MMIHDVLNVFDLIDWNRKYLTSLINWTWSFESCLDLDGVYLVESILVTRAAGSSRSLPRPTPQYLIRRATSKVHRELVEDTRPRGQWSIPRRFLEP